MPDFTPNPWMLERHSDRGNAPWEIYAWCLRDAMSKHSGIKTLDEKLALKDKLAFESLMNAKSDKVEINGQIWQYIGDKPIQEVVIAKKSFIQRRSTITYDLMPEDIGYMNNDGVDPMLNKSETSELSEDDPIHFA